MANLNNLDPNSVQVAYVSAQEEILGFAAQQRIADVRQAAVPTDARRVYPFATVASSGLVVAIGMFNRQATVAVGSTQNNDIQRVDGVSYRSDQERFAIIAANDIKGERMGVMMMRNWLGLRVLQFFTQATRDEYGAAHPEVTAPPLGMLALQSLFWVQPQWGARGSKLDRFVLV